MSHSSLKKEIVSRAFAVVYTDEKKFIDDVAYEFTIGNVGKSVEELLDYANEAMLEKPEGVIARAWSSFIHEVESDEEYDGMMAELRAWKKEAVKMANAIKKLNPPRPPTIALAHDYWNKKGVFGHRRLE